MLVDLPSIDLLCLTLNADVTIGFVENLYTVAESDESVVICVQLTGQIQLQLVVDIDIRSNTADGM